MPGGTHPGQMYLLRAQTLLSRNMGRSVHVQDVINVAIRLYSSTTSLILRSLVLLLL